MVAFADFSGIIPAGLTYVGKGVQRRARQVARFALPALQALNRACLNTAETPVNS
jgi:hypothetical protein